MKVIEESCPPIRCRAVASVAIVREPLSRQRRRAVAARRLLLQDSFTCACAMKRAD